MAKRRSKGRIAESSATYKLRMKQKRVQRMMRSMPKRQLSQIEMKANAIASLALKERKLTFGAESFILLLGKKKLVREMGKLYPIPQERRAEFIKQMGGIRAIKLHVNTINDWLERAGRPDLKLMPEEVIDIILWEQPAHAKPI